MHLGKLSEMLRPDVKKIAVGDPKTVPAGVYAQELLDRTNLRSPLEPRLVLGENVRQVLDYVMRGEVEAGIVYATDVEVAGGRVMVAARAAQQDYSAILTRWP